MDGSLRNLDRRDVGQLGGAGVGHDRRHGQAGRRMIARGERPAYRLTTAVDGRWRVDALPCVSVTVEGRREVLDPGQACIAALA
jgi:hypothetical protein